MARANIDVDDDLMKAALEASGAKTKKEAVEEGLLMLARRRAPAEARRFRGKLPWRGDPDALRTDE